MLSLTNSTPEIRAAAERFRGFFQELSKTFVERDDLLAQIALALLSREHVLMTGPPGTAKSGIAAAVLGRIVDEKTGKPSLFARQFTESTVQTDLVGPLDFKTLMATGRTEHFTDEGMLGAVHAFLDEVLDGRDMLLRTTLNVLHERELKQGTKTTAGQIECALMTTNRYLAEVLEGSRETLLAFVDRIAFVSFVPKGFADPESLGRVVRSQVGGTKPKTLTSLLTIQDLDLLQALVDRIVVPDEMCTALCVLVDHLDKDLAAAQKHDPTFLPTRYLSTRTTVRLGRILRAACVYDAVMHQGARALEVEPADLSLLRLSLLLSGPDFSKLRSLLDRETDPRERRQLSILRTERELFDRALARVPKLERRRADKKPDLAALERAVDAVTSPTKAAEPPTTLIETAAKLASVSDGGGPGSLEAATLLDRTLAELRDRALRAGATAGAGPSSPAEIVGELKELAHGLETASGSTRPVARWLRGRAIRILLDAATLSPSNVGAALERRGAITSHLSLESAAKLGDSALESLELLLEGCATLRAAGADEEGVDIDGAALRATSRVEDELVEVWDAAFREAVASALARVSAEQLGVILSTLGPALADIDARGQRLAKLGGKADSLKSRVIAPRIEPLARAAFERVNTSDRMKLVGEVGVLVDQLHESGLRSILPKNTILRFAVAALIRSEKSRHHETKAPSASSLDHAGYRALRGAEERVSLAYTSVELALRISPENRGAATEADALISGMSTFLRTLPDDLRRELIDLDVGRIDRALSFIERWWDELGKRALALEASTDLAAIEVALASLAESRFFHVTRDESALLRFALESRVLAEVFPEASASVAALRKRIELVEGESSRVLGSLRRGSSDAAWVDLLGPASRRPERRPPPAK